MVVNHYEKMNAPPARFSVELFDNEPGAPTIVLSAYSITPA